MPHILLLEDDPAIARTVAYALERDGLGVTHALLLADARRQIAARTFDLLLLDVGLPDGSGLDLCREVRAAGHVPVLMLSARGEELDRVLGLELGADDYMAKPFSPRELVARVKALLRRSAAPAAVQSAAAPRHGFVDDAAGQRITLHGTALPLTRREYRLLRCLLARPGRICSREMLLADAWGDDTDSTDRTVDTHVKTLRAKLREAAPQADYIVTHRGMGYSLELPK
jgi:two-component system, OmpR family, catabolic regulation response regulator CreB